jgi:hypothetical protein
MSGGLNSFFVPARMGASFLSGIDDKNNQHCDRQTDEGPVRHNLSFL